MQNSIHKGSLTAVQEVNYLCTYIHQYRQYYNGMANITLQANIKDCPCRIEHDLLLPLIDDAFRFGIFKVEDPAILFDVQLDENCLTMGIHYRLNANNRDERTQVTFIKLKHKLENLYAGNYILYRDYYLDSYLVLLQIQLS